MFKYISLQSESVPQLESTILSLHLEDDEDYSYEPTEAEIVEAMQDLSVAVADTSSIASTIADETESANTSIWEEFTSKKGFKFN